ncbi:hypothetical protein K503DRAFT_866616 [Rhizopogon vinicolor AM-OR11-026]|uniref:Uncharacterized protein n=1 Tax=Rhizopogon vinicolor AM-OR11-026 TaxID=1314800 RepID=A0A1B7MYW4_9AGAM|nr:hypothetical protein K503DRAFT_866616 [Rhizopogon vinicolor AM-OR11-026]
MSSRNADTHFVILQHGLNAPLPRANIMSAGIYLQIDTSLAASSRNSAPIPTIHKTRHPEPAFWSVCQTFFSNAPRRHDEGIELKERRPMVVDAPLA